MPKRKTPKSVRKKVKITKKKKVVRKYTKQNHFNSKQTGNFKRKKRRMQTVSNKADAKNIIQALS